VIIFNEFDLTTEVTLGRAAARPQHLLMGIADSLDRDAVPVNLYGSAARGLVKELRKRIEEQEAAAKGKGK
jgi:hypothetical protein